MDPLVISGAVGTGVYLYDSRRTGTSVVVTQGAGTVAAMAALRARGTVGGISFAVDPASSASSTYRNMQRASLVTHKPIGQSGPQALLPSGMTSDQLTDIATAWLAAFDAGRKASPQNYSLTTEYKPLNQFSLCSMTPDADRSTIGVAACDLSAARDDLGAFVDDEDTQTIFSAVNRLAAEMDAADASAGGIVLTSEDQNWRWSDVPGAIEHAGAATADFVGNVAGTAIGGIAGAVVGSPLFWAVGLGAVVYFLVLR